MLSLNVRGAQNKVKRKCIFDFCRIRADIVCLQETHSCSKDEGLWQKEWGLGEIIFAHGETNKNGVCIMFNNKVTVKTKNVMKGEEGKYLILSCVIDDTDLMLCNVYGPNRDKPDFYRNMFSKLEGGIEHKIIIGDFNLVLDVNNDRYQSKNNNTESAKVVSNFIESEKFVDIWRARNPDSIHYLWRRQGQGSNKLQASRIDFSLASRGIDAYIENVEYIPSVKEKEKAYIDQNSELLDLCIKKYANWHPAKAWEKIKLEIKKETTEYSKTRQCGLKMAISFLLEEIGELEKLSSMDEEQMRKYYQFKQELDELVNEKARSQIFRSKVRWYEEGEKNTSYFFSLEKGTIMLRLYINC